MDLFENLLFGRFKKKLSTNMIADVMLCFKLLFTESKAMMALESSPEILFLPGE